MIRKANVSDISTIAQLKLNMFKETGMEHALGEDFIQKVQSVYREMYEKGKAQHFVIEHEGQLIACGGAFIKEDLPYCFYRDPQYGFIGDVYVEEQFRRQGYAKELTNAVLEWLFDRDIQTVRLLASDQARKLYESVGFIETDQMILHK